MTQLHWHEGLFLQPHHLQLMQRRVYGALGDERRRQRPYPYGVVEAELSAGELENKRVRFDRLLAVMPSGVVVDAPKGAWLSALDIADAFDASSGSLTVLLGVPLYYEGRANAIEPSASPTEQSARRIYRIVESEVTDENTGEGAATVLTRKVNARLLVEGEDASDLETIPILRIVHGTGEDTGMPMPDRTFVPPCVSSNGSPVLQSLLRDIANQIEATREELVVQLSRGGFDIETIRGAQLQQLLRLRTFNRFAASFPARVAAPGGVDPFEAYLELRELLGELAALHPDADSFQAPAYDHDDPAPVFFEIAQRVRGVFKPVGMATWLRAEFARDGDLLVAQLTDEHLEKANEYFLAVQSGQDPRQVAKLVEDADEFKLMPKSMAQARVRGVRLVEERHPPVQLPSKVGLTYFRLQRSESARAWERVVEEKELAIRFSGVDGPMVDQATLYMTVPN